tara:strand:+ start:1690 stop:1950 length:261 start_codon:yes stop_codon:yes gene_type:complete
MNINFTTALKLKLEGDIAMARANIDVFMTSAVGVGEHGDVMTTIEEQFAVMATARDKLVEVRNYIDAHTDTDDLSKSHAREHNISV